MKLSTVILSGILALSANHSMAAYIDLVGLTISTVEVRDYTSTGQVILKVGPLNGDNAAVAAACAPSLQTGTMARWDSSTSSEYTKDGKKNITKVALLAQATGKKVNIRINDTVCDGTLGFYIYGITIQQ